MKNKVRSLTAICLTVCTMMVLLTISVQAQVTPPSMTCAIADNGDGTVTANFTVDTNGNEIDTARLEVLFDGSALSNPTVAIGSDFNTPGIDATTTIPDGRTFLLQTYGINGATGSGVLNFGTITFDWTSTPTTITVQGIGTTELGQGSLQVLVGESTPLNGDTCSIPVGTPTPEPTEEPTPTPTPEPESVTLTLLHNNDGESQLFPNTNTVISSTSGLSEDVDLMVGGISAFSTVMDNAIADAETAGNSVLSVYAGDSFLASSIVNCSLPPSNLPIYDALAQNLLPYDAHILGNHEFDFGPDFLFRYISAFTDEPFLSANLDFTAETDLAGLVEGDIINSPVTGTPLAETLIYTDPNTGEMFGVVGATTPLLENISNPGDVVVETADITETAVAVQTEVDELITAGIDKIILVSHLQNINNDVELISMVTGVDVAIGGGGDELLGTADGLLPGEVESVVAEYPREIMDADGNTVYLATSKGGYSYLGELEITFDADGMVTAVSGAPIRVIPEAGNTDAIAALGITDAVPGAADVDAVLADVQACIDSFATTQLAYTEPTLELARSLVRGEETNIGNLVSDSFIYAYNELSAQSGINSTNPVIAVQNGGGIRQNAGDTLDGVISRQNTLDILPFGNDVTVLLDVPAEAVKAALENAVGEIELGVQGEFLQVGGFLFTYDATAPAGSRVQTVLLTEGAASVQPDGTVTLPDGTLLVANGAVVADAPLVNIVTNSFTAAGGDSYDMFPAFDQVNLSENGALITYERALTQYLLGDADRFPTTTQDGVDLPTILATDGAYQEGGEGRIISIAPPAATTVFDIVANSTDHAILAQAVVDAGLQDVLSNPDLTFTVFAPTDEALTDEGFTAADLTAAILTSHVISGVAAMSGDLSDGQTVEGVAGNTITITISTDGGSIFVEGLIPNFIGTVATADIVADNGVVHTIVPLDPTSVALSSVSTSTLGTMMAVLSLAVLAIATIIIARRS